MITRIQEISKALAKGDVMVAKELRRSMGPLDAETEAEISEVARQAIIGYLKKGDVYRAREAERAFNMEQDVIDETVRQAILSSMRDGDTETVAELRNGLPISKSMARELVDYCATWGEKDSAECMRAVLA